MTAYEPDQFEMFQFPWQLMDFIPFFMILEGIENDFLLDFPSQCAVISKKLHKFADGHQITPVFLDGFFHISFVLNPFTLFQSSVDVCFAMFVPKVSNQGFLKSIRFIKYNDFCFLLVTNVSNFFPSFRTGTTNLRSGNPSFTKLDGYHR